MSRAMDGFSATTASTPRTPSPMVIPPHRVAHHIPLRRRPPASPFSPPGPRPEERENPTRSEARPGAFLQDAHRASRLAPSRKRLASARKTRDRVLDNIRTCHQRAHGHATGSGIHEAETGTGDGGTAPRTPRHVE